MTKKTPVFFFLHCGVHRLFAKPHTAYELPLWSVTKSSTDIFADLVIERRLVLPFLIKIAILNLSKYLL
ncbi:hypothetical protein [Fructobacillus sp. EFB-N1]|uniref:hypothetical protein n=1 Tax=Fructobacillus sp. EFB-N1 TaxID=1658766 RepID=UPI00128D40B4|nr:hypothetical protein [Fructobacillus sp. EFB-N1]